MAIFTNLQPAQGQPVSADQVITFDVLDPVMSQVRVFVWVVFPATGASEVVYDNSSFAATYSFSSIVAIPGGRRFALTRTGGWPSMPRVRVDAGAIPPELTDGGAVDPETLATIDTLASERVGVTAQYYQGLIALGTNTGISVGRIARLRSGSTWRCTSAAASSSAWVPTSSEVNVLDFGADETGATETVANINAAIDYQGDRGGGRVVVPFGTYLIDADTTNGGSILPRDNILLDIEPGTQIVVQPNTTNVYAGIFMHALNNVEVRGGELVGERDDHTDEGNGVSAGHGIRIEACNRVTVSNMRIADFWGDGVYLRNGTLAAGNEAVVSTNITFRKLECDNNRRTGIAIVAADGVLVEQCHLHHTNGANPFAGINIEPNIEGYVRNITVRSTVAEDNDGAGYQTSGYNITFEDPLSRRNEQGIRLLNTTGGLGRRIRVNGGHLYENVYGIYHEDAVDVQIDGTSIYESTNNGIHVRVLDTAAVLGLHIRNVKLRDNANIGIYVSDAPYALLENVEILDSAAHGLFVERCPSARINNPRVSGSGGNAIHLEEGSGYKIQCGEISYAAVAGLVIAADAMRCTVIGVEMHHNGTRGALVLGDNNTILGNHFHSNSQSAHNTYDNLEVTGAGNVVDANVSLRGAETNIPRYAIRFGATSYAGNKLGSNNVTLDPAGVPGGQSGQISDNGDFTHRTIRHVSAVSFPNIANGSYSDQTVTVNDAAVGDFVSLGPPSSIAAFPAGFIPFGFVNAADTVTIRLVNNSGVDVDPPTATWYIEVRR